MCDTPMNYPALKITLLVLFCSLLAPKLQALQPLQTTSVGKPQPLPSVRAIPADTLIKLKEACETAADYSTSLLGHAVLVLRGGETVFERYNNGWKQDLPHGLASGTKSFVGVVAAAAVEDGLMTWDELVCETITQWKAHPQKSKITARHLLNLSSGLDPSDDLLSLPLRSKEPNLLIAATNVPIKHEAGSKFEYGPSHFYAFGEFLQLKIIARNQADPTFKPKTFTEYMYSRVLDPIGVKVGRWGADREGNLNLPGGARLTAREWAKFGEFIREQGQIRDAKGEYKSLIGYATLAECFKPSAKNPGYGLTWWLIGQAGENSDASVADGQGTDSPTPLPRRRLQSTLRESLTVRDREGKPVEIFMAAGKGKQRLYVIPSYGLTIVRFAKDGREGASFSNQKFLEPILRVLEPIPTPSSK